MLHRTTTLYSGLQADLCIQGRGYHELLPLLNGRTSARQARSQFRDWAAASTLPAASVPWEPFCRAPNRTAVTQGSQTHVAPTLQVADLGDLKASRHLAALRGGAEAPGGAEGGTGFQCAFAEPLSLTCRKWLGKSLINPGLPPGMHEQQGGC